MSYRLSLKLQGPDGGDVVLVEGARVVWSDPAATDGVDVAGRIKTIRVYDGGDETPCAAVDVAPDLGDIVSITDPGRAAASGNLRIVGLPLHCVAMPRGPSDPLTFLCRSGERLGAIDPAERSKHAHFPYGAREAFMARSDACPGCVAALVEPAKRVFRALSEGGELTPALLCERTGLPWSDVDDGIVSLREIVESSFGNGPQRFWLWRDAMRQERSIRRDVCETLRQAHADLEAILCLANGIGRKVAELSELLGDDAGGTPYVDAVDEHGHAASAMPRRPRR